MTTTPAELKIPVRILFSGPFVYPESAQLKKELDREYPRGITITDLKKGLDAESLHPSLPTEQTIKCILGAESEDSVKISSCLDQSKLEEAFLQYESDRTARIIIKVQTTWPAFPSAFGTDQYGDGHEPKTLVELRMMHLSAEIRRKDLWYEKMNNPEISARWSDEARSEGMTDKQVSYVMEELKYYASLRVPDSGLEVSDIDGVWHSDILIDASLRDEFKASVAVLEDIPESKKDWHPGSNNQVWDLVHPSLYPLVYGKTRVLPKGKFTVPSLKYCGGGQIIEFDSDVPRQGPEYSVSKKFSWLPSEFMIHQVGRVTIESYINNLHPVHHKEIYPKLEKIFAKFVPLFENVINDQLNIRANRVTTPDDWYGTQEYEGDSEDEDYEDQYFEWQRNREIIVPEPQDFVTPPTKNPITLRGSQVQVIVKLANIVLTPENPKYSGGVWHVEGMKNENIIATGIYYYDVENISESELGFRQNIREPYYEQGDDRGVYSVFGLSNEDPLNQQLGSVVTKENRCLAFPNMYQHRVSPFELTDKTKPGHRKILVFFLVNPGTQIVSTLTVPPQQLDWFRQELLKEPLFDPELPSEVVEYLVEYLDWPVTLKKAKEWRQELMDERKYFISNNNEECFQRPFSLCEH